MAYFLVFDLTNPSTFEYVKMIYLNMSSIYEKYYVIKYKNKENNNRLKF